MLKGHGTLKGSGTEASAVAPTTSTRQLLDAWRKGCLRSEEQLFGRHRVTLLEEARRSRMMRFLQAHTTEEDLVDEVFLRALASRLLSDFEVRGPGSLRRALGCILQRVLIDACRRAGAQRRHPPAATRGAHLETEPDHYAAADTTPSQHARASELLALCKQELPLREWNAWWLVEVKGLSSAEAAEQLGSTSSAIRSLLLRARQRLVTRLEAPTGDRSNSSPRRSLEDSSSQGLG